MKSVLFRYSRHDFRRYNLSRTSCFVFPAICILIGELAAVSVMHFSPDEAAKGFGDAIVFSESYSSVLSAYWKCSRYHILTALLSTSYLGVVLIPALLVFYGFSLLCTSAALVIDNASGGVMLSSIILGLPGLISVPCLLSIAAVSMQSSECALNQRFGLRQSCPARFDMRWVCLCFICLIPAAVVESVLVPMLISFFVK